MHPHRTTIRREGYRLETDIIGEIRKGLNALPTDSGLYDACQVIVKGFELAEESERDPVRKDVARVAADAVADAASYIAQEAKKKKRR